MAPDDAYRRHRRHVPLIDATAAFDDTLLALISSYKRHFGAYKHHSVHVLMWHFCRDVVQIR